MNRVFHLHIAWYQYFYLVLLGVLAFFFLWDKYIIPAALCMILLVVLIERLIHTTYTITPENELIVRHGRFFSPKTLCVNECVAVQERSSVRVMGYAMMSYVLIEYAPDKYVSVQPQKQREFVELLRARNQRLT